MALSIETFSNLTGGSAFFKAIGHPLAAAAARRLVAGLAGDGPVAVYDPLGLAEGFAALHDLSDIDIEGVYVQRVAELGNTVLGRKVRPVTALAEAAVASVLVVAFDAGRLVDHIAHLVPDGAAVVSLDRMRLPESMLSDAHSYLEGRNFATNFAFFRDSGGRHTRLVTANYWTGHGARDASLWLTLFGADGATLAQWTENLASESQSIVIDSAEIRRRFELDEFTGQLFLHACGISGHDLVKYGLDTYDDDGRELSSTHDANAWPADKYAGLPAPRDGERVLLWVQNAHPCPIPPRELGLNCMGSDEIVWLDDAIAPFATVEVDVAELLPGAAWPQQIEIQAGKYIVRPRYEVEGESGRRRIAHVNVERTDLEPDPAIAEIGNLMGKGYIVAAPILPPERWRTVALPTPMSTCQHELPLAVIVIDASGSEIARRPLGRLARDHRTVVDINGMLEGADGLPSGYGHLELVYDFSDGGAVDGWLHALFRYEDRASGHAADTSFGAHIFNTVLTYGDEPQSYVGRAPGLSTRLFLRLGRAPHDTLCHLIYPASTPWHAASATDLVLYDGGGVEAARRAVEIPCGGSYLWRYSETFDDAERGRAGDSAYVVVRDKTCRLFGYHGLLNGNGGFSLDHMFGF